MPSQVRAGLPGSWFIRSVNHAQRIAACLVLAFVVCGDGIAHGRALDTGASEEMHPNLLREGSSAFDKGPGSGSGHNTVPVNDDTRSSGATPQLDMFGEEFEERKEDRNGKGDVPQCYSSPDADPSEGIWRKTEGGVVESPAMKRNWILPSHQFDFLQTCNHTWEAEHPGNEIAQPYWVWEPKNCALKPVTEAGICGVMEGRKGVLLVGDSLTRLFTTTLASILGAKAIAIDVMGDEWSACEGKLPVRFVRNDYLNIRTSPFETVRCEDEYGQPAEHTHCSVFADNRTLEKFDTLVVNSGAHTRPEEVYGPAMRVVSESLAASMRSIHGDDAVLVVRNTPVGHWDCTERMFSGPTNSSVATDLVNAAPEMYKWHNFRDYNALLKEAFLPEHGWRLLDAFSPTLLRPDSHIGGKDCLHYCLPGPADHWIVLFYNILLASSTGQ